MADRRQTSKGHRAFASWASIVVASAGFSSTSIAASGNNEQCPEISNPDLAVSVLELAAEVIHLESSVSSIMLDDPIDSLIGPSTSELLAPLAEAAVREIFETPEAVPVPPAIELIPTADTAAPHVEVPLPRKEIKHSGTASDPDSGMNTRLPGVSDVDFSRYKKQMFRRDI